MEKFKLKLTEWDKLYPNMKWIIGFLLLAVALYFFFFRKGKKGGSMGSRSYNRRKGNRRGMRNNLASKYAYMKGKLSSMSSRFKRR